MHKFRESQHSIGKLFRRKKGISQPDPEAQPVKPGPELQEYIEYLQKKGLEFKKIQVAQFKTKNGLPYTGLMATEKILSNEIFIKIPQQCLLNTRICFFSDIQKIFEENPWFFSNDHYSWEDNIFWTYLLYENQKGKDSSWYLLLKNLPREIDYIVFWKNEELQLLEDKELIKQAQKLRRDYERDYKDLSKILKRYPQFFKPESFCYEDAKWIYCHITSRCFGKYLENVTMVPFVELINHECVDVYYDYMYNENNPAKSEESKFDPPQNKSEAELLGLKTSDCSNNSDFYDENEDYVQEWKETGKEVSKESPKQLPEAEQKSKMNEDLQKEIASKVQEIELFIYNNIDLGDSFSVYFAAQIYDRLEKLSKQSASLEAPFFVIQQELKSLELMSIRYKEEVQKYYKSVTNRNIVRISQKLELEDEIEKDAETEFKLKPSSPSYFPLPQDWKMDKFDYFVMKCANSQQFLPGSQVYFCYGRVSNRLLLLRYGFALEYNKYDSLHLQIAYLNTLDGFKIIKKKFDSWKNMCKYKQFKIKRTKFNVDIIYFVRNQKRTINEPLEEWFWIKNIDLELTCLDEVIKIYEEFLNHTFSKTLAENELRMKDPSLGYHEYFALVYKVERQRIATYQITLLKIVKEILTKMGAQKVSLEDAASQQIPALETQEEFFTNRQLLTRYFDRIKIPAGQLLKQ